MRTAQRETVQELLSREADPQSEDFWRAFRLCLEISGDDGFDRRAIINLKLLFTGSKLTKDKVQILTLFVAKTGLGLKNDFTADLGDLFLQLLLHNAGDMEKEAVEYSNVLRNLAMKNPIIKATLFDSIIFQFIRWLYDPEELPHRIISELFLMNITLISGPGAVKSAFCKHISILNLSSGAKLLASCNDSTAQITIAEWMWRAIKLLKADENDIDKALGEMYPICQVSKNNFRESLHEFIRSMSGPPTPTSVLHIAFDGAIVGNTSIECSGCLDVNEDNVTMFFYQKKVIIPDVVIFRSSLIKNAESSNSSIAFTTREKTLAFRSVCSDPPEKIMLQFKEKPDKEVIKEYLQRLKMKRVDRRSEDISSIAPQRSRTIAPKNAPKSKSKPIAKRSNGEKAKCQTTDINEIEQKLDEYAVNSQKCIESSFETFIKKTSDVIDELSSIQSSLSQLLTQHIETTTCTTRENSELSTTIVQLQKEFESRHNEAVSRRESVKRAALDSIEKDKTDICVQAAEAFNTNAIVGFTAALIDLPQRLHTAQFA